MRDNFYHWFVVSILFAMFFGAEVARAEHGSPDWFLILAYGAIGFSSSVGALTGYKNKEGSESNG